MAHELWTIPSSPWSIRTVWCLKMLKFRFVVVEYVLPSSEWKLRFKLMRNKITVPALVGVCNGVRVIESTEIVQHAQDRKPDPNLPDLLVPGVQKWINVTEKLQNIERTRVLSALYEDRATLKALAKKPRGEDLGTRSLTPAAIKGVLKKHPAAYDPELHRKCLTQARAALERSGTGYLLQQFSYADICMVCALQTLSAASEDFIPLPAEIRQHFQHPELAGEFSDLLEWRDGILAKHWVADGGDAASVATPSSPTTGLSTGSTMTDRSGHVL